MINKIIRFADDLNMFPEAGIVLACVSGGADSMCLLYALLEISRTRGFEVSVAHYNHQLRGGESERDESFVKKRCEYLGVAFYSERGDVRNYALQHKIGIEQAARVLRYAFFYAIAEKVNAARIATAHTADDNTETVIMNIARGAGAAGLSGIPPVRDSIIRPMLRVSRTDVLRFAEERDIPFISDSTNELDIYTRNKIRHSIIPVLSGINPQLNEAAAATAELARADEEYLSGLADEFISGNLMRGSVDAAALTSLPPAISGRVVRKLCGGGITFKHVEMVMDMSRHGGPSARLSLPGMTVFKEYGRVVFGRKNDCDEGGFQPIFPNDGDNIPIPGLCLKLSCKMVTYGDIIPRIINKSFTSFIFKYSELYGKLTVRPRREGDAVRLLGKDGTKTLKKLFIEHRIPARKRDNVPVIADDLGVLAIYGLGPSDRAVPGSGDLAVQIEFEDI